MYMCNVYDSSGQELAPAYSSDAIVWAMEGIAYVIEYYEDPICLRTVNKSYKVPKAIVLTHKVKRTNRKAREVPLSNHNLFLRDDFTCQYCGRSKLSTKLNESGRRIEQLEREHVIPKSVGGSNTWDNCVAACTPCNARKGNRTPEQAGMRLRKRPYIPTQEEIDQKKRRFRVPFGA